jgi:ribose transport system substrate-binding protein
MKLHSSLRNAALLGLLTLSLGACNKPAPTEGGASAPAGAEKPKKVAFVTNGVASFWTIASAGVKAASRDFKIDAQTLMPAEGISDQKRMIEDLLTRGIDGIALSPIDPTNQTELINTAAKKTKVITHDSDAPQSERLLYIGMDNYKAGRMCGELVREAMPAGGTIMIFIGRLEQDNAKRRRQGVIDAVLGRPEDSSRFDETSAVLEGNGFKILGTLTDQFDRAKGKANAEDALAKYPDIGCMVGLFAYNPPLILEALTQSNKLGTVKLVAFDEDDATLDGIEKGTVFGTVVQDPYMYGYKSIEVLSGLLNGKAAAVGAEKFLDIPARKIRKENVVEFRTELKTRLGAAQ